MASLSSLIDSKNKAPSATVKFNGNRSRDILNVSVSSSLEGSVTSATIRTLSNPSTKPESRVTISQGYNGNEELTFTGFIDTIERNEADATYTITCRDVLKKALDTFLVQEVKFGQDVNTATFYYSTWEPGENAFHVYEYGSLSALHAAHPETNGNYTNEGVYAHAVVQWLLHMCGLEEGKEIQVDNTNFFIGDISPAKFHLTSIYDACMQIANLIGWRLYADAAGVARFKKKPRQPGGYTYWTYTDKVEPHNIHRLTYTQSNIDLRNYVEVRGASGIKVIKNASSPYLGSTPYRGVLVSDELIDTPGMAEFIAARILGDLNRLKITVTLEADGNPKITPGSTLNISSTAVTGKYLVEGIQTEVSADGGYKSNITASAYLGDTVMDEDPTPDIVAAFVPTFVSVLGDPKYIVTFDGKASYSSQGAIAQYYWQWPDGSTYTSADSTATFVFDSDAISDGNAQNVTLTVTDAVSNTASVTNPITKSGLAAQVATKYRQLYGAMTTQAIASADGGLTWTAYSLPAISVAASNFEPGGIFVTSGHALFGTSDGAIYRTFDRCTSMQLVNSPGGEVTDIHIPELDATKAAAVTSTGKVLYSDDRGVTWRQIGAFDFPLREVKMGYTDFKNVTVVGSGTGNIYVTFDTGGTWSRLNFGIDTYWATDGALTNYYAHASGVRNGTTASDIPGVTVTVPAATVAIDDDSGVMAVDSTGQHWIVTSGSFVATQYNPDNLTRHMIRDGEMALVTYYATQSGVGKSVDRNVTMETLYQPIGSLPTDGWGRKVAYGPLAAITIPGQLVYRGPRTVAPNTTINGWWIATTSGWVLGYPNTKPNSDASATIGGFAIGTDANPANSGAVIDYLECLASGAGGGITGMIYHSGWVTCELDNILSYSFSNRLGSRDQLCITGSYDAGGRHIAENVIHFTSAIDKVQSSIEININPLGTIHHTCAARTTDTLGGMLSFLSDRLFSAMEVHYVTFNADGSMTDAYDDNGSAASVAWAAHYKGNQPYRSVGWPEYVIGFDANPPPGHSITQRMPGEFYIAAAPFVEGPSVNGLLSAAPMPYQSTYFGKTFFEPVWNVRVRGSCIDQSRVYYAYDDGSGLPTTYQAELYDEGQTPTGGGIGYADGYGTGKRHVLLDQTIIPSGQTIYLNVVYNATNTADYITAIIRYGTTANYATFYSTDSGETFQRGPDIIGGSAPDFSGGDNMELWYIDLVIPEGSG